MGIGIVTTKYGKMQGVEAAEGKYAGITYFKGVRYGATTAGENRFKPPVDQEPWAGVRICDTYRDRAMQPSMGGLAEEPYRSDFYFEGFPQASEDCLFLNVTTGAQSPEERRPVYIWFHGGGLGGGYSYESVFENSELARKGVVVVTVGHRLNVFGYLALPQLSAEQGGISGNYGLMDEIKALDWVYENIAAFGGDPENITVGGQSGGTAKSGALAGSPRQKGRVKRVINQSNLNWVGRDLNTMEEAEKLGQDFLAYLGIAPDISLEELRALPAERFYGEKLGPLDMAIGAMVADGVNLKYKEMYRNINEFACDCDYISGGNFGESNMLTTFALGPQKPVTEEEYYRLAKEQLGDLYEKYEFEKNFPCTAENADRMSRRYAALGISMFGGTIINRYFGAYRKEHQMKGNTYSYLFSRVAPCHPEEIGTSRDSERLLAWHSSELWYTFASLRRSQDGTQNIPPVRPWTEYDVELADKVSSYWANFMKTGDPNGEGLPYWPKSDEEYGWIELGDEIVGYTGRDSLLDQMLYEHMMRREEIKNLK
ncbi:MAG: carboxylesterase/lipase family protein [Lachnospiraceae bacterium]|nr:carboxylesterase/lipase family protein [Lachnospiraceae bacterium]